jgi:hypothetical protein
MNQMFGDRAERDAVALRILAIARLMQWAADRNEQVTISEQMIADLKLAALCVAASEAREPAE